MKSSKERKTFIRKTDGNADGGTVSAGETPDDAMLAESRHVDPVLIRAQVRAVEHDILNEKIRRLAEA